MKTKASAEGSVKGEPALLSPETLDKLADLVVAKLIAKNENPLPSKQVVAGLSPVSRSNFLKFNRNTLKKG